MQLGAARVVLCVAQKRPYKNLHSLVRALRELEEDVVLVLPGAPTAYERRLRALADELGVAESEADNPVHTRSTTAPLIGCLVSASSTCP